MGSRAAASLILTIQRRSKTFFLGHRVGGVKGVALAGYSGTPLAKKLGIKADTRLVVLRAPPDFPARLAPLPPGVVLNTDLRGTRAYDVIVFFADSTHRLTTRFAALVDRLSPAGGLWIAWPKQRSGVATDLSGDVVRRVGLRAGLVDNKVCAVDDTWSGLRFVVRLKDRR